MKSWKEAGDTPMGEPFTGWGKGKTGALDWVVALGARSARCILPARIFLTVRDRYILDKFLPPNSMLLFHPLQTIHERSIKLHFLFFNLFLHSSYISKYSFLTLTYFSNLFWPYHVWYVFQQLFYLWRKYGKLMINIYTPCYQILC